ncbi:MAG: DNA translocase FtsK [Bacilli bacterium]|nr:DNA translocase FtsK [Bacilli bacterium]
MNKTKFVIPQVEQSPEDSVITEKKEPSHYRTEPFISSVFGTKVKDEITFNGAQYGNRGRQYDVFRDKEERIVKDDYKDYITYHDTPEYQSLAPTPKPTPKPIVKAPIPPVERPTSTPVAPKSPVKVPLFLDDEVSPEEVDESKQSYDDIVFDVEEEKASPIPLDDYQDKPVKPAKNPSVNKASYIAPPITLLKRGKTVRNIDMTATQYQRDRIDTTLRDFGIDGHVVHFTKGPAVTQFEVQLEPGIKVQKVKNIASNIQANLKARTIRIQAPIPGKSTIGIEVPNSTTDLVLFGELLSDEAFLNDGNPMNAILGLDLGGNPVYLNLAKMPHCLIAGTTGSGKSVCINSIIASVLYKAHPDDVKLILIDPKVIEFAHYEDIPHLATPVITEPKIATAALKWAVDEMENRYQLFRALRVREYEEYSKVAAKDVNVKHIPYILIIIDELADLMLTSGNDVEDYIQRLTQKGRACGIHLIVATQRPSVDVIKGTIKTNIPTRIAFMVKTQVDSAIILDHSGAEKLLGHGDMLYNDSVSEERLQGSFISSEEIISITNYIRSHGDADFMFTQDDLNEKLSQDDLAQGMNDEYFAEIARFVVENNSASINRIQQTFKIGFNRAQAIMQALEDLTIVSENLGSRARVVQVNAERLEEILEEI